MNIAQSHNLAFQKTIIGLFTALFFVSIAGCKINVGNGGGSGSGGNSTGGQQGGSGGGGSSGTESGGGQQGGGIPTGNFLQTGYKKTGTQNINGTEYDLVTFGNFPQSEKIVM